MFEILDILFLQPLMVIYRWLFDAVPGLDSGPRIIVFALLLNLLLAPAYRQMEARAKAGREKLAAMNKEVARMKANFRGRERYFYIRAVHRQFGHHPIHALLSSNELLLQILVFATVFQFLSGSKLLDGHAFGQISDLGQPDGLLGGLHLLPLLMTAINVLSVTYYVKDKGQRGQGIALALVFLVLLYASPSGLVLYWTINNLWSLVRNMAALRR